MLADVGRETFRRHNRALTKIDTCDAQQNVIYGQSTACILTVVLCVNEDALIYVNSLRTEVLCTNKSNSMIAITRAKRRTATSDSCFGMNKITQLPAIHCL
jgi:hypothetical protein